MNPTDPPVSLLDALASVPDPRGRRGRSYTLSSILALAVAAMLRGFRGDRAIAPWGRLYHHLVPRLGFTRPARDGLGYRTPCFSELAAVFAAWDAAAFEDAPRRWIAAPGVAELPRRTVALDGKTARGSRHGGVPGNHLLSADCREVEAVLVQLRVPDATDEHEAALELLKVIPLEGTVVTGDAAFCQRDFRAAIVAGGGDSVVTVKANQPTLRDDIATGFARALSPGGAGRAAGRRPRGRDPQ
jgi:hypothetical protein